MLGTRAAARRAATGRGAAPVPDEVAVPGFLPSTSALPIRNAFPATGYGYPAVPVPLLGRLVRLDASDGLCGGLVLAALDAHRSGRVPASGGDVPDPDGPLFRYLVARQRASVLAVDRRTPVPNGLKAVVLAQRRGDLGAQDELGRSSRAEWVRVRADLADGRPSLLYLLASPRARRGDVPGLLTALRRSHQVLAYASARTAEGRVVLRVLDPNDPADDDATVTFDPRDGVPLALAAPRIERRLGPGAAFRGFFRGAAPPARGAIPHR